MKKIFLSVFIALLMVNLIFAAQGSGVQTGTQNKENNQGEESNLENQIQSEIQKGSYTGENGEQIQVKEKTKDKTQLRINGIDVNCSCNITNETIGNKTKLKIKLSNGKNAEIKIMPETASETALARLRLKVCSEENNCTIILKEVGKNNETKPAYEIQARRHAKLLGMFKLKMQAKAQVDAETGELISVKKPWWAFLASESEE